MLKIAEFPKSGDALIQQQVEALEAVLAEAKAGNFETLVILAMTRDGQTLTKWTVCEDLIMLLGHIARLAHNVQKRMDGAYG